MINIEFGGGDAPKRPKYLQCDIRSHPGIKYVCNTWEIDQYVDANSVDIVFSRHMFEHLTYEQGALALDTWYDILKIDGICEIILPNLTWHIEQWQNPNRKTKIYKNNQTGLERAMEGFYGKQRESMFSTWDLHKSGYDLQLLKEIMQEHKFVDIKSIKTFPKNIHLVGVKK